MRLTQFSAQNVHGFLDFKIDFFDEITFLIGINGSGKTSALQLILGLTEPSYNNLSNIDYSFCQITAHDGENEIIIKSIQEDKFHFKMILEINGIEQVSNLFKRHVYSETDAEDENNEFKVEEGWRSVFGMDNIVKKIKSFSTPKFLGLERRILGEYGALSREKNFLKFRSRARQKFSRNGNLNAIDSSLFDVQILVFDYIRSIAQKQPQISSEFKDKIFRQSFNFISDKTIFSISTAPEELIERKNNTLDAVHKLGLDYLETDVENYFTQMIDLARGLSKQNKNNNEELYADNFMAWLNNFPQLKKIDEIIEFSKEYQSQLEELRTPIVKLEKIASKFLNEGNKFLRIEPDGEIRAYYKNGNSADIYKLSSGEKQIIIMIAHLIFAEDLKDAGVFVIDEPELSLHIAWQEIFVDAILEASPHTQFILATHSPSIISKVEREQYCQDISDSYNA